MCIFGTDSADPVIVRTWATQLFILRGKRKPIGALRATLRRRKARRPRHQARSCAALDAIRTSGSRKIVLTPILRHELRAAPYFQTLRHKMTETA